MERAVLEYDMTFAFDRHDTGIGRAGNGPAMSICGARETSARAGRALASPGAADRREASRIFGTGIDPARHAAARA